MNVSEHTARVFDTDLIKLTQMVAQMGGFAQKQITDSIDALTRRDVGLARQVIAADATVDALQRQIEEKAIATIALRQPMAIDLRALVAMLRIANDLERVGDLAKNIGKRVIAVSGDNSQRTLMRGLKHMATLVVSQLAAVLDSFVDRNPNKALQVWQGRQGSRRALRFAVPGIAHLFDGRPGHDLDVHPPSVLRQEHRADRRPRHQHRRGGALHGRGPGHRRRAAEGRHFELCRRHFEFARVPA